MELATHVLVVTVLLGSVYVVDTKDEEGRTKEVRDEYEDDDDEVDEVDEVDDTRYQSV